MVQKLITQKERKETDEILSDPATLSSLHKGIRQAREGKTVSFEEAKALLFPSNITKLNQTVTTSDRLASEIEESGIELNPTDMDRLMAEMGDL